METIYAFCAGIITVCVVAATVQLVLTLKQMRHTARAVEFLALNANDRVESLRGLFNAVDSTTNGLTSLWFRAVKWGMEAFSSLKQPRQQS